MGPEGFDVVGRAEGLQIRLRRSGEQFTQEFAIPASRLPLVHCGGRDLHMVVDGAEVWSAYSNIGVARRSHGLCLQASLRRSDFEVETALKLSPDRGVADITTTFIARQELLLSALENVYRFTPSSGRFSEAARPDYAWLPNLKYAPDCLAGQHSFRSPSAFIQHGDDMVAIIPCLAPFTMCSELPAALDYFCPDELRFGLAAQAPEGHVVYRRKPDRGRRMKPGDSVSFRFSLMLRGGLPARMGHRDVVRFLWARYGPKGTDAAAESSALLMDDYCRYAFDHIFGRQKECRGHVPAGFPCGGPVSAVGPRENKPEGALQAPWGVQWLPSSLGERVAALGERLRGRAMRQIPFLATANAARTAYGLAGFGRRWSEPALIDASKQVFDLVLSAPPSFRLFPAVYAGNEYRSFWSRGTRGHVSAEDYHVPDSCETGVWLLRDGERGSDPVVLHACREMAQALLPTQSPSGAVPSRLAPGRDGGPALRATEEQRTAAAAAGRFLLAFHRATGDSPCLKAAQNCAEFVIRHIFPARLWQNEEALSLEPPAASGVDPVTGLPPQSNLCMYWASELMRDLYIKTSDERYLQYGLAILDELLLFQQIWDAPFMSVSTLGGFGVSNTDARWNDARAALFSDLLLGWYEITGQAEYFTRGVLALRSAFSLMRLPGAGGGRVSPNAGEEYGAVYESCGYNGRDSSVTETVTFDWGGGSACAAAALALARYGDVFVDAPRRTVFALNGCRVRASIFDAGQLDLTLDPFEAYPEPKHRTPLDRKRVSTLRIRFRQADDVPLRVRINGIDLGRRTAAELAEGLAWPSAVPVLESTSIGPEKPQQTGNEAVKGTAVLAIATAEGTLGSGDDDERGEGNE